MDPDLLGGMAPDRFLREYWQRRPLLIRGALPGYRPPFTAQELAGLSCEESTISRLILESGGDYPWQVRHGPFGPEDFAGLPASRWTLLVQEVDRSVSEISELLDRFRFVPNWRIDDVMASYAPAGGSAGAHYDNYDVFLLQAAGRRCWQIDSRPVAAGARLLELDVKILADFEPDEEWVLEPGDMLYLPPRIAHHGVAVEDCMTFSIGFRAPSHVEMAAHLFEHLIEGADPDLRLSDPDLRPPDEPGEIAPRTLERARCAMRELLADDRALDRWFGRFVTAPVRGHGAPPEDPGLTADALAEQVRRGAQLERSAPPHFAFVHGDAEVRLYVGGEEHVLEPEMAVAAALISGGTTLDASSLGRYFDRPPLWELLLGLVQRGYLILVAESALDESTD